MNSIEISEIGVSIFLQRKKKMEFIQDCIKLSLTSAPLRNTNVCSRLALSKTQNNKNAWFEKLNQYCPNLTLT